MPRPTANQVHVNRPLTDLSVAYAQARSEFVWNQAFPQVMVDNKSDDFYVYSKDDWFRDEARERAPGTESSGSGFGLVTNTYSCKRFAHHKDVDDDTRDNADAGIDLDRDAAGFVVDKLWLKQEKRWAANFFTTGIWGLDLTGVAAAPVGNQFVQWDQTGSDPVTDVDTFGIRMRRLTGQRPNLIVVGPEVFVALKNNAAVLDRIKYTERAIVTEDLLASMFGVKKFLVAFGSENTAAEGAAASFSFLFGKRLLLAYSAERPGLKTPSAGYTFTWKRQGGGANGLRFKTFRMEQIESDRNEGDISTDPKLVAADLGIMFDAAVA